MKPLHGPSTDDIMPVQRKTGRCSLPFWTTLLASLSLGQRRAGLVDVRPGSGRWCSGPGGDLHGRPLRPSIMVASSSFPRVTDEPPPVPQYDFPPLYESAYLGLCEDCGHLSDDHHSESQLNSPLVTYT